MVKGIFYVAVLAVALVLDLAESLCITYCQDYDETDLFAVGLRNQEVVETFQKKQSKLRKVNSKKKQKEKVVEQLERQLERNQKVVERFLREVSSTEERNQQVAEHPKQEVNTLSSTEERNHEAVRRLQDDVTEQKGKLSRLEKIKTRAVGSCKQILDGASDAANGAYWICVSPNCADAREVFCDMNSGGWTLIGQLGGVNDNIYDKWLVTNVNTGLLQCSKIENGTFGCIDAVDLAVNCAHETGTWPPSGGTLWARVLYDRRRATMSNHNLNLALPKAGKGPEVQNLMSTLRTLAIFFKYSPKGRRRLEQSTEEINDQRKGEGLKKWVLER
ncbi:hypothetical protein LSAT2_011210 [Lamellibrachia satsuma]|nr:hypothetical protein LSAT2_011210 [Lamellibrachia satsuma]